MTDKPSEAALRKACEVLGVPLRHTGQVINLARHFDAEDKAAREALDDLDVAYAVEMFTRRHVLPANPVTVEGVLRSAINLCDESLYEKAAQALRDAGLLKDDKP